MTKCEVCKKKVSLDEDLAVVIEYMNKRKGVLVHRGECDDLLREMARDNGGNAMESHELKNITHKSDIEYFLKHGDFTENAKIEILKNCLK